MTNILLSEKQPTLHNDEGMEDTDNLMQGWLKMDTAFSKAPWGDMHRLSKISTHSRIQQLLSRFVCMVGTPRIELRWLPCRDSALAIKLCSLSPSTKGGVS